MFRRGQNFTRQGVKKSHCQNWTCNDVHVSVGKWHHSHHYSWCVQSKIAAEGYYRNESGSHSLYDAANGMNERGFAVLDNYFNEELVRECNRLCREKIDPLAIHLGQQDLGRDDSIFIFSNAATNMRSQESELKSSQRDADFSLLPEINTFKGKLRHEVHVNGIIYFVLISLLYSWEP